MNYLKASIQYSLDFMPRLVEKKDPELIAEPLLQLIRDIYLYKVKQEPFKPVADLIREMSLDLSEDEQSLLSRIENSQRKQKDYIETMADTDISSLNTIINKTSRFIQGLN